uniref:Uncharacterized protein n=1 Tax=Panagrolaimus sp. ES5 TaxID=591445 RepID=A0AC34F7Y4_9BILA
MSESGCMDLIRELEEKLKTSDAKIAKMFKLKKDGIDETGSGESNASNGWSDMDIASEDVKEEESTTTEVEAVKPAKPTKPVKVVTLGKKDSKAAKEKEPSPEQPRKASVSEKTRASTIDIYEVVNLKSELRKLEAERDDLKRELENEQRNREAVNDQLDQLKKTLAEKKSDLEQTAKDKDYFRTQTETLSQRVAEYTQKIERLQEDREKVFVLEKDILVLSKEKEEAYSKIKDLEKAVRKAEEQSTKLETRYFHEERRLKEHMYKLEEQLTKSKISTIALENAGSGNSSDRGDFLLANRNNVDVPSLWSDLDGPETSFDDSPHEVKRESRRRSIREQPQQPMESGRRSRQSGGAPSPYLTGGLPPPPHSRASPTNYYEHSDRAAEIRRSTGRLSRNGGQLAERYYSSGSERGSALSPPPQIASRSEIKPNVQLHKPAPKRY